MWLVSLLFLVRLPPTKLFPSDHDVVTDFTDQYDEQPPVSDDRDDELMTEEPEDGARTRLIREEIRKFNTVRV